MSPGQKRAGILDPVRLSRRYDVEEDGRRGRIMPSVSETFLFFPAQCPYYFVYLGDSSDRLVQGGGQGDAGVCFYSRGRKNSLEFPFMIFVF